jgi:hypothetical protein
MMNAHPSWYFSLIPKKRSLVECHDDIRTLEHELQIIDDIGVTNPVLTKDIMILNRKKQGREEESDHESCQ